MITVNEKSTIAAISELRTKSEEILRSLSQNKVILQKHNKPVAVMLAYSQYQVLEKMLDLLEDYTLGALALDRDRTSRKDDFVDIDRW